MSKAKETEQVVEVKDVTTAQSDFDEIQSLQDELNQTTEENTREYYKQQADVLGINYPNNITTEKLKEAVAAKMKQIHSQKSTSNEVAAQQFEDMRALVRIQINVLNPAKQSWTGEIFTVGNDVIPHMTRFIPFNAVGGIWHVERMFVEMLKSRKYQAMSEFSGSSGDPKRYGVDVSKNRLLPEFSIIELPPLTKEELEELGLNQAANGSIQEE